MIVARALLITAILSQPSLGREWLCVPEMSTGFKWMNDRWESVNFNTPHQYVLAEVEPYEMGTETIGLEVTEIGKDYPAHRCPPLANIQVACGGLGMGFIFNVEALRYQELFGFGYVDGGEADGETGTPYLEIGKCSPLR